MDNPYEPPLGNSSGLDVLEVLVIGVLAVVSPVILLYVVFCCRGRSVGWLEMVFVTVLNSFLWLLVLFAGWVVYGYD